MREWWEINLLTTCPIHHTPLVAQCHCGTELTWTDRFLDRCDHCEAAGGATEVNLAGSTEFERWLAGRLELVSDGPTSRWLDGIKLGQSIRLIESVGLLARDGFSQARPAQISDLAPRNAIMASGFETLQSPAFEEVIHRSVGEFRLSTGTKSPKRAFDALGWFGDWFGDEDIANEHPFHARLVAALDAALGFGGDDDRQTGVMDISILADRCRSGLARNVCGDHRSAGPKPDPTIRA